MGDRVDDDLRNAVLEKFVIQQSSETVDTRLPDPAQSEEALGIPEDVLTDNPLLEVLKKKDPVISNPENIVEKRKKITETFDSELMDDLLKTII